MTALAAASLLFAAGHAPTARVVAAPAHVPIPFEISANGEYLIQFTPRPAQRGLATEQLRDDGVELTTIAPQLHVSLATMTPDEVAAAAAAPGVIAIDPNDELSAAATQPDPPWGLDRSDQPDLPLDASFTYSNTAGAGTTIYVIDSGINLTHDEFAGRLIDGYDDVRDGNGTNDCFGHGTHVAGIAAGTTYGVAKLATLVPVRVLKCDGKTSLDGVLRGINWVLAHHTSGRAVANMSIGGDGMYVTLDNAIASLVADGVAVAVAAGNGFGANACNSSPARATAAITVGSITAQDTRSPFSNVGSCVDVFAPGSDILSAWKDTPTATRTQSGTSMSTPHVSGALAVLWTDNPSLTAPQAQLQLLASSTPGRLTDLGLGSPNLLLHLSLPLISVTTAADAGWPAIRCAISPLC